MSAIGGKRTLTARIYRGRTAHSIADDHMRNRGCFVFILSLASVVVASPASPAMSPSGDSVTDSKVPPIKLDMPDWRPLTGVQISAAFAGRDLLLDTSYQPFPGSKVRTFWLGGCPPKERFDANGVWTRSECQRRSMIYSGRWEIETFRGGERLCVAAPDFPKLCRIVWLGTTADRVFMAASRFFGDDESMDDPKTFNPYRLVRTIIY